MFYGQVRKWELPLSSVLCLLSASLVSPQRCGGGWVGGQWSRVSEEILLRGRRYICVICHLCAVCNVKILWEGLKSILYIKSNRKSWIVIVMHSLDFDGHCYLFFLRHDFWFVCSVNHLFIKLPFCIIIMVCIISLLILSFSFPLWQPFFPLMEIYFCNVCSLF